MKRTTAANAASTERHRQLRAQRIEDLEDLLAVGESPERIAARLGVTLGAIERQMQRCGRNDLARIFGRRAA